MTAITKRVRVTRNRYGVGREEHPWLVTCEFCAGDDFMALFGKGTKGWAPTWDIAQDYATRHALAHEARRCPTCLHVPTGELPEEASCR